MGIEKEQKTRVFVYGTLLLGESNSYLMKNAEFDGVAITKPEYELVDMKWYPAAVQGGKTMIWGEVYLVDSHLLAAIDKLEGHPNFYCRQQVQLADGSFAHLYRFVRDVARELPVIASGNWRKRERTDCDWHRAGKSRRDHWDIAV